MFRLVRNRISGTRTVRETRGSSSYILGISSHIYQLSMEYFLYVSEGT